MRILTIDPGTKTGWAFWEDLDGGKGVFKGTVESGVQNFSLKRGESAGMRFIAFRTWFGKMLENCRPQLVVYEQGHKGILKGGCAADLIIGMSTRIQEICEEKKTDYTSIYPTALKKFATGKGNAKKEAMLAEAKKRWPNVEDDNQADALWILEWAKAEYKEV